jgi:8-oxo-dGTP pyrophosphatase MutT (NUDIX family)
MKAKILALGNWDVSEVKISLKGEHKPSKALKKYIKDIWDSFIQKYPEAFNGVMLGLSKWSVTKNKLSLSMRSTDYASYVATRNAGFTRKFPASSRANPLGITIIVFTSDGKIICGRRSAHLDQNPGKLYFVGGYLGGEILEKSVLTELKEELNIDRKDMERISAHCLAYNTVFYHPEIFVKVVLAITGKVVKNKYLRAKDIGEIERLFFYTRKKLISLYKSNHLPYEPTWGFEVGMKYLVIPNP